MGAPPMPPMGAPMGGPPMGGAMPPGLPPGLGAPPPAQGALPDEPDMMPGGMAPSMDGGGLLAALGGTPDPGGAAMAQSDPMAVLMWLMNRQSQAGQPGMEMGPPDPVPSAVPPPGGDAGGLLAALMGGGMGMGGSPAPPMM